MEGGSLSTNKLAETLTRIGTIFARTAFGSDEELTAAVDAGNLTPAEAMALGSGRE